MTSRLDAAVASRKPALRRRRFVLSGLAGSALLVSRRASHAQVGDINDAINKAGRQRMLSQRMAKAWLAIGLKVDERRAPQVLTDSTALFERQLAELKAFAPTPDIRATYDALQAAWGDYKVALAGAPERAAVAALVALDTRVLALAHKGTLQLEKHSGKSVGRLVNIAGRERMLSQRMAKFYLTQCWQIALPDAATELDAARAEFVKALKTLHDAPEDTPAINSELELADNQWVFFDHALKRIADAPERPQRAADVFSTSENILQVMDRVTGLYARMAA